MECEVCGVVNEDDVHFYTLMGERRQFCHECRVLIAEGDWRTVAVRCLLNEVYPLLRLENLGTLGPSGTTSSTTSDTSPPVTKLTPQNAASPNLGLPNTGSSERISVLQEAQTIIHGQRCEDYGAAEQSFHSIARGWSVILDYPVDPVQVALCMDWLKTCRFIASRDRDSLVDKGGYTGLAAQIVGID